MAEYRINSVKGLRGYSPGRVVHFVFQDEWLEYSLLCFYDYALLIDRIEASLEPVNCLTCLCLYVGK